MDRDSHDLQDRSSILGALGYFTHGVYIVGTRRGRQHNAMTASWVMQTSERPPAVAVAIKNDRYTHDLALETGTFSLSVLGEDQVNAATYFAETSGEYHEKFVGVPFGLTPSGSPYLLDCLAYLDCRILDTARAGDHTVMVAEITAADTLTHDVPLTYDPSEYEQALS
ncbi:flavin reductase family protein [Rubrobacter indicoceani]|uniref:flavin reductase family protein n=1 Tax=Rubrobacter indicoceani TaxID=2051957 RepID=UPI0013C4081C|nr:flavin reductase family protein [Rubrobacter indicoceani]